MICSGSRLHFSQLLLTYCNTEGITRGGVKRCRDRHLEGIVEVHDVVRTLGLRSQSVLHTEHHAAWTQGSVLSIESTVLTSTKLYRSTTKEY